MYTKWLNDPEIIEFLSLRTKMISLHSEKEHLEKMSYEHNYGIITKEDNKLIGNCGFLNLDHLNRNCEVGIFIGDKEYLGKGYGTEALKLLISYGINNLNIRNFMLRVFSNNERAIKSYRKSGFKKIGNRRKSIIAKKRI